jgi:hypothetical protein
MYQVSLKIKGHPRPAFHTVDADNAADAKQEARKAFEANGYRVQKMSARKVF